MHVMYMSLSAPYILFLGGSLRLNVTSGNNHLPQSAAVGGLFVDSAIFLMTMGMPCTTCRAHDTAAQQLTGLQQDLLALQQGLHADQVKLDKLQAALAAEGHPESSGQQAEQLPSARPQGKCTTSASLARTLHLVPAAFVHSNSASSKLFFTHSQQSQVVCLGALFCRCCSSVHVVTACMLSTGLLSLKHSLNQVASFQHCRVKASEKASWIHSSPVRTQRHPVRLRVGLRHKHGGNLPAVQQSTPQGVQPWGR